MKANKNDVKALKSLVEKYGVKDVISAVKVLNEGEGRRRKSYEDALPSTLQRIINNSKLDVLNNNGIIFEEVYNLVFDDDSKLPRAVRNIWPNDKHKLIYKISFRNSRYNNISAYIICLLNATPMPSFVIVDEHYNICRFSKSGDFEDWEPFYDMPENLDEDDFVEKYGVSVNKFDIICCNGDVLEEILLQQYRNSF